MPKSRPKITGPAIDALLPTALRGRRLALGLCVVSLFSRLIMALALASIAGSLVTGDTLPTTSVLLFGFSLVGAGIFSMAAASVTAHTEERVAGRVLSHFESFAARAPVRQVQAIDPGDLTGRMVRQPAAAAAALVSVPNSKTMTAIGALAALTLVALFSWQAGALLILTFPVMIMFFILVGGMTSKRAAEQEEALQKLSGVFADRVRCLPTIVTNHAEARESERLVQALGDYRRKAGGVLSVAFLNAGVLDFFSALSIAMLAIFLGLGHLGLAQIPGFAGLTLTESLSILVLAPEVYQPMRRFAENYHQAAEGRAALAALDPIVDAKPSYDSRLPAERFALRTVILDTVGAIKDIDLPKTGLVVIAGPSGCGKTSLLQALAGVVPVKAGQITRPASKTSWAAADAWLPDNVAESLKIRSGPLPLKLDHSLRFCRGESCTDVSAATLSGGERLRLSLLRAARTEGTLFVDEPTAKLDRQAARSVRSFLKKQAQSRLVVAASHDPALINTADVALTLQHREDISA